MSNFVKFFPIFLLSVLSSTNGVIPIIQFLSFGASDGTTFAMTDVGRADMSTYTNLINYLKRPDLNEVCVEGTWKFYELRNWEHIGGKTGLVLEGTGRMNESNLRIPTCSPFTAANGANYASKLSYRILGPEDLSQRSITLYEKRGYAGRELKITAISTPTINLPAVGSFRITAPTDSSPVGTITPQQLRTIIKAHSTPNAVATAVGTCYALINPEAEPLNNPKFYNVNQTSPSDVFASINIVDYLVVGSDITDCDGANSVLILPPV